MQTMDIRSKLVHPAVVRSSLLVHLTILLLCAGAPAASADPAPELLLRGDFNSDGELRIGSHLDVAVSNGEPLRRYTILLVDEGDDTVASIVDLMTDAFGNSGPHRLWTRTGVVGCDPGAVHDPSSYQFESFAEAESVLDGRTFRVLLVDRAESLPATAHAGADLPMVVVTRFLEGWPCDGAGCLRTVLEAEPLHLAIRHQAAVDQDFMIFVVAQQSVWLPGDPLVDVRPGGAQMTTVPAGADPWVELLWAAPVAGDYQIVVRQGNGTVPLFDPAWDLVIETPVAIVGSTFPECTLCLPPK